MTNSKNITMFLYYIFDKFFSIYVELVDFGDVFVRVILCITLLLKTTVFEKFIQSPI